MATIVDVAREAGVSLATVSRVLNKSFMVSDEKCQRVYAAMEKVGYKPQPKSPAEKESASHIVLVITSLYFADLFDGLSQTARSLGYSVLFSYTSDREDGWENAAQTLKLLDRDTVCGVMTLNAAHRSDRLRKLLQPYPLVQMCEPLDMKEYGENFIISIDNVQAAYDMARHLIHTGRRRIALVTIDNMLSQISNSFVKDRETGFYRALEESGLECPPALRFISDYTTEGATQTGLEILALDERPDAIFCISDTMAYGCLRALREAGVDVPGEIAVCGFDNMEFSDCMAPPLTSIDQSFGEMGVAAMRMLHDIITGSVDRGRKLFVDHQLVVRGSTVGE